MRAKALSTFLAGLCLVGGTPKAKAENAASASPGVSVTAIANTYAQSRQRLIDTYKPFLALLEGTRYNIYDDKGNAAVGWGYNFDTNDVTKYKLIQITPQAENGKILLRESDMRLLASDKLTLAQKQARFPKYVLSWVEKTAKELKAADKPKGLDTSFQGSIFVMPESKVDELNTTRLNFFVDKVVNGVGAERFYSWSIGKQMACVDMYYPLRDKFWTSRFYNLGILQNNPEIAKAEAWTSDLEKNETGRKKRRQTTREVWVVMDSNLSYKQCTEILAQYKKDLPGENALYNAMETYITNTNANYQKGKTNAASTQNSPNGR